MATHLKSYLSANKRHWFLPQLVNLKMCYERLMDIETAIYLLGYKVHNNILCGLQ